MSRFVFNWALDYWIKEHERGEKRTGWMRLYTKLTELKQTEYQWMYKYSDWVRTYALKNCDIAYQNFFRRIKAGDKPGFPKFKSKYNSSQSFTINGKKIRIDNDKVWIPKIGWIRLKEIGYIPVSPEKICYATVSKDIDRWFISLTIEEEIQEIKNTEKVIGIDLGIKSLVVTSDGDYYENMRPLYEAEDKLKRMQRWLSRKEKGSVNYKNAKIELAKAHRKVGRIRKHIINEITTELAKKRAILIIEDLNVKGMMSNHHLAKAISDVSFFEFRRQLEYKCKWYGSKLVIIDRWYPSSKLCSRCGAINNDLKLSDRIYKCDCGLEIDRDLNAAINIRNYYTLKHSGINACGDENKTNKKPLAASLKQEVSII